MGPSSADDSCVWVYHVSVVWACSALDVCFQVECVHRWPSLSHWLQLVAWSGEGAAQGPCVCLCVCDLQNLLAAEYKYLYGYLP